MAVLPVGNKARRLLRGGGFSLIELVAVIVVAGILAASAILSINSLTDNRTAIAAKQAQRDLTFARQWAVATGSRTWVEFDAALEKWTVRAEDPDMPGKGNATIVDDPATGGQFIQTLGSDHFSGVSIATADFGGNDEVGFDWLGRPLDELTTTVLTVVGSVTFNDGYKVTVQGDTGHIGYVKP